MSLRIRRNGSWYKATHAFIKVDDVWEPVLKGSVRVGGSWHDFYTGSESSATPITGGIQASITPSTATGTRSGAGAATSNSVTVSTIAGTGTVTYAWTRVSGSSLISANSPAAATTTFGAAIASVGSISAVFRCTCTDSVGSTTVDITVTLTATTPPPPPTPLSGSLHKSAVSSVVMLAQGESSRVIYTDWNAINPVGGSGSYTYEWSCPGATAETPYAASTRFYRNTSYGNTWLTGYVTLRDTAGNSVTYSFSVQFSADYSSANPGEYNINDLSPPTNSYVEWTTNFGITVSGGSGNFSYNWYATNPRGDGYSGTTLVSGQGTTACSFKLSHNFVNGATAYVDIYCQVTDNVTGAVTVTGPLTMSIFYFYYF